MKKFIKILKNNLLKSPEIRKSILLACTISIIIPLALPLITQIIFGIDPPKHTVAWSLSYDSQKFIFVEISIAELSLLLMMVRFIPFIIFGYTNGLISRKVFSKNPVVENTYLISSSIFFYLIIIVPMFKFFVFLDSIKFIRFIYDVTDAFNF